MNSVAAESNPTITILKELDEAVRKPKKGGRDDIIRDLSTDEWTEVQRLVVEADLPCTLKSTGFGFSFALEIFQHSDALPDTRTKLEPVLVIERSQFPFPREPGAGMCRALDEAFAFVRRPRNVEMLQFYKMRVPDNPNDYTY